ncbi:hypothetical protein GC093_12970 [Paenibacillus sp. LMG 31456]|uniref:OmpR/PhoB-type domain-containing protein n=1 Tax=Paenibacillus foliorum TaxID=2654974 RepID=A0A972K0S7_9BACL|nr:hypothetical protein [Paenibacillus foliorum]NOU94120.1 hypothetical protein [Paenibacillus foliorum]
MLHHRGKVISKNALLELLWPESDERKGLANLQTSNNRIRTIWKDTVGEGVFSIRYALSGYVLESNQLRNNGSKSFVD